jgi:hypothetical protein
MSTLLPNRVFFHLHRKIGIQTLTGFHQAAMAREEDCDERKDGISVEMKGTEKLEEN